MSPNQATADVFYTALKSLPKAHRDAVLVRIAGDRGMRHDLLDLAVIAERRHESARPFRDYVAGKRRP